MTTLIHTADVHLRPDTDERWDALQTVLNLANDREADVLTIGGDLFDRPEDVETLRTELRTDLFTDQPFEILLIPGNHDVEAFRRDLFFGDDCAVLTASEDSFDTWISSDGDLRIVGIPYQEEASDDLLLGLEDREPFDGADVLLFHGSLDAPMDANPGDEDDYRYFPVTEEQLAALAFDYYLAGHYHNPHHRQIGTDSEFAYSGTPASTSRSEVGRRQVVTVDTTDGFGFERLDSFHHLERTVTVTPGDEDEAIETISEWVGTNVTPLTKASITVEGVIDEPETAFDERLREAAGDTTVTNRTTSVEAVIDHPVLQQFDEQLTEKDWDEETKTAVRLRMLRAASEVESSGGLN